MEKLFVSADNYLNKNKHKTKFIALRYGNVLGSSGSVVPFFIDKIRAKEEITITDDRMTRFSITMDEALDFILESVEIGQGSDIFIPKLKAYSLTELKDAIFEIYGETQESTKGIRPGEKLHETLINFDEVRNTIDIGNKFVILKPDSKNSYENSKMVDLEKGYSSDVTGKLSKDELKKLISENIKI